MNEESSDRHPVHGEVLNEISEGIVALLKRYYGRGPTQAKTYYQDDIVVCLLRGWSSPVEQTLLDAGRVATVMQQRSEFHDVMRGQFAEIIEQATGRQVIGFMSGNQHDPAMLGELFVLAEPDHQAPAA